MNFYLIPGENEAPISHLTICADGEVALAGTVAGTLLRYEMDGNPPSELARPRASRAIAGLAFAGRGREGLALSATSDSAGDILEIHPNGGVELLYADAPFAFGGLAMSSSGSFGLIAAGGQLLKYFPEQKSYLPVDTPEGLLLSGISFVSGAGEAIVVGAGRSGGILASYAPQPGTGRLHLLACGPLPPMRSVASDSSGRASLAGGQPGSMAWIVRDEPVRTLPGPSQCEIRGVAFHPSEPWALVATGPAGAAERGAQLFRFDSKTLTLSVVYDGPPGAGSFTSAAFSPDGSRALVGTEWGQLLEVSLK